MGSVFSDEGSLGVLIFYIWVNKCDSYKTKGTDLHTVNTNSRLHKQQLDILYHIHNINN